MIYNSNNNIKEMKRYTYLFIVLFTMLAIDGCKKDYLSCKRQML